LILLLKNCLAYNSVDHHPRAGEKGLFEAFKGWRAHVYTPLVGQKEATRSEIGTW